jgi:hypothetical protein
MKNYLKLWTDNILERKSFQLQSGLEVVGERKAHLGARCEIATIRLTVTPAENFQVYFSEVSNYDEVVENGYLDAAVFGILDVLLVGANYPLTEIAIIFRTFEIDPIESNVPAFRQAGRDAGRKILEGMRENMFKAPK